MRGSRPSRRGTLDNGSKAGTGLQLFPGARYWASIPGPWVNAGGVPHIDRRNSPPESAGRLNLSPSAAPTSRSSRSTRRWRRSSSMLAAPPSTSRASGTSRDRAKSHCAPPPPPNQPSPPAAPLLMVSWPSPLRRSSTAEASRPGVRSSPRARSTDPGGRAPTRRSPALKARCTSADSRLFRGSARLISVTVGNEARSARA
jgi:hypothetical protein